MTSSDSPINIEGVNTKLGKTAIESQLNDSVAANHARKVLACQHDIELATGIVLGKKCLQSANQKTVLLALEGVLGVNNISADPNENEHYRKGWRSGSGAALAVIFPHNLEQLWASLKIAVENNLVVIMQAANTGLTEGSAPNSNDYDRPVLVINTLKIDTLYHINKGKQVISLPGVTLHKLEQSLNVINRSPHSVIGSSMLGATVVGGIANNSGGALVKRGPAYTELSVYAYIDAQGELKLVNHLGVYLGDTADAIIRNLQNGSFELDKVAQGERRASDTEYKARIQDVDAETPSRFNADPRRLYEASGCAGKLAVFAVRVDTHPLAVNEQSFYVGTNNPDDLYNLRRLLLTNLNDLPEVGEYMHRDVFDIAEEYGKDTFLSVLHLGTHRLPKMFAMKGRIDATLNKISWLPNYLTDRILQTLGRFFPKHLPKRMKMFRAQFEHHLMIKLSDSSIETGRTLLTQYFRDSTSGAFFECTPNEAKKAYLHRFAAAGAAMRYQTIHHKKVGDILALDIALKRNEKNWVETFCPEIEQHIEKKFYYGHFFCYVFHQDYILKKGTSAKALKGLMLAQLDKRGAKYPAEHNVGHLYKADDNLSNFYRKLDPTNTFNPGIGCLEKTQRNCDCCL